jgi:60 kDa SS-A/Ro ribonucleoprotein
MAKKNNVYASALQAKKTPQNQPIPGRETEMAKNNAGGYTFTVTPFIQLERFLILGSDKPTYYSTEQKLTKDNAGNIRKCLELDGTRTVDIIVDISSTGRAPKNDPALFAMAVAASPKFSNPTTVQYALSQLSKVARTGTHMMQFTNFVDGLRGWGRSLKRAEGSWYTNRSESSLAHTLIKYQSREGWSNRDLLRLSHAKTTDVRKAALLAWSVQGGLDGLKKASETWGDGVTAKTEEARQRIAAEIPIRRQRFADAYSLLTGETANRLVAAYEAAKKSTSNTEICKLIRENGLTREMLPTQFLNEVEVWEALLEKMPLTALVRNLGKMSSIGLLKPLSAAAKDVVKKLTDLDYVKASRLHPLSILLAQGVYRQGRGVKGSLTWTPVPNVIDALEDAFYAGFANVIPTGRSILIGHDVSGSMGSDFTPGSGISCAKAGAAMGLVFARTEKNYASYGFASGNSRGSMFGSRRETGMVDLGITAKDTLESATQKAHMNNWGGTDCSLPMRFAQSQNMEVDAFIVITDNETWAGEIQPIQALRQYRSHRNVQDVKLIVMGMTATNFSIADPTDPFNLDVVGFDAAAPSVVCDFIRGNSGGVAEAEEEN